MAPTPDTLARAQAMYEALLTPAPTWAQLGPVTRSVWIERAEQALASAEVDLFGEPDLFGDTDLFGGL